uniref:Uncharacterized protein n=1 Tax=Glossina brevipalpis TaxID=37001 RepID=A0A1A9WZD0_9MUSC
MAIGADENDLKKVKNRLLLQHKESSLEFRSFNNKNLHKARESNKEPNWCDIKSLEEKTNETKNNPIRTYSLFDIFVKIKVWYMITGSTSLQIFIILRVVFNSVHHSYSMQRNKCSFYTTFFNPIGKHPAVVQKKLHKVEASLSSQSSSSSSSLSSSSPSSSSCLIE